jgi:hypothetical protein
MRVERGTPDSKQAAAYANADVKAIVHGLMQYPDDIGLREFARQSMISPSVPTRAALAEEFDADGDRLEAVVAIAEAGAKIETAADADARERRKGAVVERLVYSLIDTHRSPLHEAWIETTEHPHSEKPRSGLKDIVVDGETLEVYECKFTNGFEQWEINELADILLTAKDEGRNCVPCIATLGTRAQLDARAKQRGIIYHQRLFFVDILDLHVLRHRAASGRLR